MSESSEETKRPATFAAEGSHYLSPHDDAFVSWVERKVSMLLKRR